MSKSIEEKLAMAKAKLAKLEQEFAIESNPRLKEVDGEMRTTLKVVNDMRRKFGRAERVIATATKKLAEQQAIIDEKNDLLQNFDSMLATSRERYDSLASEKAEITESHVDSLDSVLQKRDEATSKSTPPSQVTDEQDS